jgi:hypothetical protein
LTPVQSASGFQKSVKIWIALASFSLLRTGERTLTVLPAYCCSHLISPPRRLSPAAALVPGAELPVALVALVAPGAAVSGALVPLLLLPQATRTRDVIAAKAATRLPYLMLKLPPQKHPPSALASAVPAGATPNADIGLRLEMVWNLMEDSEG